MKNEFNEYAVIEIRVRLWVREWERVLETWQQGLAAAATALDKPFQRNEN